MMAIKEYLRGDCCYEFSKIEKSRLRVGCYKTHFKGFRLHVTSPVFLTPDITYMFEDKREGEWLVVELYQFTSYKGKILYLEILFEDCGLAGDSYIEGIEFRPLEKFVICKSHEKKTPVHHVIEETFPPLLEGLLPKVNKLLQFIVDRNCDLAMRQVASIHFKNFITENLSPHDPGKNPLFEIHRMDAKAKNSKEVSKHDEEPTRIELPDVEDEDMSFYFEDYNITKHANPERDRLTERSDEQERRPIGLDQLHPRRCDCRMSSKLPRLTGVPLFVYLQFDLLPSNVMLLETKEDDKTIGQALHTISKGIHEKAGNAVIEVKREIFVFGKASNKEIVRASISPLFTEEAKVHLSQGILLEDGKMWLSLSEKGEHHVEISIKAFSNLDGFSEIENSRFAVGCCMINDFKELKLRVTKPLLLSPNITYGLNLVVHCSEREKKKQPYVGVSYKIEGETKISILRNEDKREGNWLVAELYQYTSYEDSTLDLEILLEDCGLAGDFYIEGIEFRPLEKAESALVEANEEIVTAAVSPLFNKFTEVKVFLSQGVLLDKGKMVIT
ncbi:hypothetical protein Tco_1132284 [Tanacetum coccineum]|uniref:Uncharacterized protein n=1 Tax=Tanacetum coccineum TaxID=301880 RepID=A0ABQ5JEI7_9ASTR